MPVNYCGIKDYQLKEEKSDYSFPSMFSSEVNERAAQACNLSGPKKAILPNPYSVWKWMWNSLSPSNGIF